MTRSVRSVGVALALVATVSCARQEPLRAGSRKLNVLVITLDTIRADRLGAYGNPEVRTGYVDGLAARGVVFDSCVAPTPLTLPSHTSIFTGTYPIFNGVRDNGNYVVPGELTTMAELFSEAGYQTGGFVGAFVLSSRWGLNQGFATYTEPKGGYDPELVSFAQIQRPADAVVDDAIAWLEERGDAPFFAWVHLYDPHMPYDPPPAFAAKYPDDPYLGEVAFADSQLDRLDAYLESSGLGADTLVVFAGDHGEGLGDHGELDHGLLLYQTTARAPLIMAHPDSKTGGVRRGEIVSLVDILPTVADAIGLPLPEDVQGRSLWPLISGNGTFAEQPVYAETFYPMLHFGWSPLTAIQDRRFQLIQSSEPELYDLDRDPEQRRNIYATNQAVAEKMSAELDQLSEWLAEGAKEAAATPDAATIAKLAALGYVVGGQGPAADEPLDELPSPKNMLWVYNLLMEANNAVAAGDEAGGERALLEILAANDTLVDGWVSLGKIYRRQGRFTEAVAAFREAHARRPLDPGLASRLATALLAAQQPAEAEQLLLAAQDEHPDDPYLVFALARVLEKTGRLGEAEVMFRRSLELDPHSAPAHVRLAALALQRGDVVAVEAELAAARQLDPRVPEAHLVEGQLFERRKSFDEAVQAYRDELELSPRDLPAALALSRLEGALGRPDEQERVLRTAIRANPTSPGPYLVLALTFLQREERYTEAVELAELALDQKPTGQELALTYMLLADLHNRLGNPQLEAEYARLGRQAQAAPGP